VEPVYDLWMKETTMGQKIEELPGYDDIFEKILEELPPEKRLLGLTPEQRLAGIAPEKRLSGLTPEQRLAGIAPEKRLSGLTPEQQILALSDDVLRQFPDSYLCTLPAEIQDALRRRIGRPPPAS
jgi:hypothetical protein